MHTKNRIAVAALMLSSLGLGAAHAMNIGTELDPVQRQADRWGGAYAQPHNRPLAEARYHWERGGYLPYHYLNSQYLLQNWQNHRLYQPPRGYQWYGVGNDYVLASQLNGVIAEVLRGR